MGGFEDGAKFILDDGFAAIRAEIEGKPYVSKMPKITTTWYRWLVLEDFSYTHIGQDIHNGYHQDFKKGEVITWRHNPEARSQDTDLEFPLDKLKYLDKFEETR